MIKNYDFTFKNEKFNNENDIFLYLKTIKLEQNSKIFNLKWF